MILLGLAGSATNGEKVPPSYDHRKSAEVGSRARNRGAAEQGARSKVRAVLSEQASDSELSTSRTRKKARCTCLARARCVVHPVPEVSQPISDVRQQAQRGFEAERSVLTQPEAHSGVREAVRGPSVHTQPLSLSHRSAKKGGHSGRVPHCPQSGHGTFQNVSMLEPSCPRGPPSGASPAQRPSGRNPGRVWPCVGCTGV